MQLFIIIMTIDNKIIFNYTAVFKILHLNNNFILNTCLKVIILTQVVMQCSNTLYKWHVMVSFIWKFTRFEVIIYNFQAVCYFSGSQRSYH
jgi:hypothetical protein